jgi:hypothetical protein
VYPGVGQGEPGGGYTEWYVPVRQCVCLSVCLSVCQTDTGMQSNDWLKAGGVPGLSVSQWYAALSRGEQSVGLQTASSYDSLATSQPLCPSPRA